MSAFGTTDGARIVSFSQTLRHRVPARLISTRANPGELTRPRSPPIGWPPAMTSLNFAMS